MTLVRQTTPAVWTGTGRKLAAILDPTSPPPQHASALSAFPQPEDRAISSNVFPSVHMRCRDGTVAAPLLDTTATRHLLVYGEYLLHDGDVLSSYLRPGDTVLDIGAGVGEMAMVAARKVGPEGSVIALEADRVRHQCLVKNARLNQLSWLEVRRQQAGKKTGKARLADAPAGSKARLAPESIDLVSLDSLGLSHCALVTINAQGNALDVLDGGMTLIKQCQPVLYLRCSVHDDTAAAAKVLLATGYQVFQLPPPAFRADNYRKCGVDLFSDAAATNLLALPPGNLSAPDGAMKL